MDDEDVASSLLDGRTRLGGGDGLGDLRRNISAQSIAQSIVSRLVDCNFERTKSHNDYDCLISVMAVSDSRYCWMRLSCICCIT